MAGFLLEAIMFTCDDEVVRLGHGLIDRTVPKTEWTHEAHFAATLWLLSNRPAAEVVRDLPGYIRTYNESVGGANTDTAGYHETITQASIRAADAFLAENRALALYATCNALMASPLGRSDWPLAYWSRDRLFSVEARRAWVEPDLLPLPF
jgi:hypothetical protein